MSGICTYLRTRRVIHSVGLVATVVVSVTVITVRTVAPVVLVGASLVATVAWGWQNDYDDTALVSIALWMQYLCRQVSNHLQLSVIKRQLCKPHVPQSRYVLHSFVNN